jgi:hypothetical protein
MGRVASSTRAIGTEASEFTRRWWPQTETAKAWIAQAEAGEEGPADKARKALVRLYQHHLRHLFWAAGSISPMTGTSLARFRSGLSDVAAADWQASEQGCDRVGFAADKKRPLARLGWFLR